MRFLVTGGLGFIGSNFILHVLNKNPEIKITNIDAKLPGHNPNNLKKIKNHKNYNFVKGNINNKLTMEKLIKKSDIVFNFAAESHVDRSISNPKDFIDSNFVGVFNILEAVKKYKKKLIQISTDEVFGSLKNETADEQFPYNPSSPYSSTKASAELLINSYQKTYDTDVIITRCTNNFGPRQYSEKLIPRVVLFALKNKKIPVYGSGKAIRDWLYVLDHCDAILKVAFNGKSGESYNISGNNEINNLTIIKKILKILGKSNDSIIHTADRPGHDYRYSLDSTKIRKKMKWKPKHEFDSALLNTIKWYLDNKDFWKNMPKDAMKYTPWKKN
jgi:dTDP-glucose 4,6-dehydratase